MDNLEYLIEIWSKETKKNKVYITNLCNELKNELIKQGLNEDDLKFYPYLIIKIKKKLCIETNSVTLKRFKKFLEVEN